MQGQRIQRSELDGAHGRPLLVLTVMATVTVMTVTVTMMTVTVTMMVMVLAMVMTRTDGAPRCRFELCGGGWSSTTPLNLTDTLR